jgi:hypothetical protein
MMPQAMAARAAGQASGQWTLEKQTKQKL